MSDKNIILNNSEKESKFNSSDYDFDVMPDEFFNSQYQQSRVRKEQQLQKEKELIDRKKREKEEKLRRLAEVEKIEKEKEEIKKEKKRREEEEKAKKLEEKELINRKKQEIVESKKQEEQREREKMNAIKERKREEKRKRKELNQKAREEKRNFKRNQKEILKKELEEKEQYLRSQNQNQNGDKEKINKEVEKALLKERKEILKRLKLEQKINKKEQRRILLEKQEEERQLEKHIKEEAQKQLEAEMANSFNNRKSLNLDFVEDDRLKKIEEKKAKKRKVFTYSYIAIGICFVAFILIKTKVIVLKKQVNEVEDYSIRFGDNAYFSADINNYKYEAIFNDRRDIEDVDFKIEDASSFGIKDIYGVFSFSKEDKLNGKISIKVNNLNCENGDFSLNYFNILANSWEKIRNLDCEKSSLSFDLENDLYKYYVIINANNNYNEKQYKYDSRLDFEYLYEFSKFADYFNYKINGDIGDYLSLKEREIFGLDNCKSLDCDNDGYLNGEEIINLYDPTEKTYESTDTRILSSDKVLRYDYNDFGIIYPASFSTVLSEDILYIRPNNSFDEYFKIELLNNENYNLQNLLSLNWLFDVGDQNKMFVAQSGDVIFIQNDKKILKIGYVFDKKESVNYVSTYLMMVKSINFSED